MDFEILLLSGVASLAVAIVLYVFIEKFVNPHE
jgi:hypothetical protein